ncbi:hypothetical protein Hamer_G003063 [Homarus americanus]|uniref:Uncharacterized protein n=1 Tax=Homarus americanus TaxID=6706 RepID=A0A8J5JKJ6_HOMAM|nr:hypothetical protein Hamer_G016499 [Homarus americanus]KAG7174169.1 hypothetical protein Hamer_G003063 [Homarus americanus]
MQRWSVWASVSAYTRKTVAFTTCLGQGQERSLRRPSRLLKRRSLGHPAEHPPGASVVAEVEKKLEAHSDAAHQDYRVFMLNLQTDLRTTFCPQGILGVGHQDH